MNILFRAGIVLAIPFFLVSCGDDADHSEVSDNVDAMVDSLRDDRAADKDEEFVEDVLEENTKAVAWLKAGSSMGTDAQLKKNAASMLADHEALGAKLRGIASSKAFDMDDLDDEDSTADATNDKRGADWDDDWADKMVSLHQKMMERLDDYADDTKDADIAAFINEARPRLAGHLEMSEALADRLKD